jgi:hypothetical protein
MANFNEKLSSRQTSYNNAGAITVALITAGLLDDADEAKACIKEFADAIYADLSSLAEAPTRQAAPAGMSSSFAGTQSQSPADAGDYVFGSGKHDGKTISEVADEAPDYLDWYAQNVKRGEAVEKVKDFLNGQRSGV